MLKFETYQFYKYYLRILLQILIMTALLHHTQTLTF